MSGATLFGLCGAALVGLGLWGLICHPGALRKILAFNLLGSGVFLLFGAIARRGGGALSAAGVGVDSDPVPQALIITGLVVAFAATALGVALLQRFAEASGRSTLEGDGPAPGESQIEGES
jgi:multicomponent Na+:H+ antiporter subunit C